MIDSEPVRLRLDSETEPDFRLALLDSHAELPSETQLAALRVALVAEVGEPMRLGREPNSSLGTTMARLSPEAPSRAELRELRARLPFELHESLPRRPPRRVRPRAATIAAWLLPFAAAAAAAGYFLRDRPKPEQPAPALSHEPASLPPSPPAEPVPALSASSAPTLAPSPSARLDVSAPSMASQAPKPSELELMHDAKAALAVDPGHALSLLNRLGKLYPSGVLAQEREVLAIDALLRLGRKSEANARATRFSSSYPSSAHWPHIQRLLSNAGL